MSQAAIPVFDAPVAEAQPRWYAAYTCPRHEKYVADQLDRRQIESFLPLYEETHRWKDRRKVVQMALFPGYVFVRTTPAERLRVLNVAGLVRLVGFGGAPAALPDGDIESLRRGMGRIRMEPHPYLKAGRRVRILHGPLSGLSGTLVRRKEKIRVVVSVDLIMRSLAAEVDEADIAPEP